MRIGDILFALAIISALALAITVGYRNIGRADEVKKSKQIADFTLKLPSNCWEVMSGSSSNKGGASVFYLGFDGELYIAQYNWDGATFDKMFIYKLERGK